MNAKQLKKHIGELNLRRNELRGAFEKAASVNAECQQQLVKAFTAEAQKQASDAFANYASLRTALETIESELEAKRAELEQAQKFEAQESTRAKLKVALRNVREVEEIYRLSRVRSDQALVEHVGTQVDAHFRWRQLQSQIATLYKELGERVPEHGPIQCPEQLEFGMQIDSAGQQLLNQRRHQQVSKAERTEMLRERSRREEAARQRQAAKGHLYYPSGSHPGHVKQLSPEPPRTIYGPGFRLPPNEPEAA